MGRLVACRDQALHEPSAAVGRNDRKGYTIDRRLRRPQKAVQQPSAKLFRLSDGFGINGSVNMVPMIGLNAPDQDPSIGIREC